MSILAKQQVVWEVHDNFQKQTYRNRCYIATDQGRNMLNIPIKHVGGDQGRQQYKEVILDHSTPWQKIHWKTLQTAYRTSPFFEFYEDELAPLFEKGHKNLMDFNFATIKFLCESMAIEFPSVTTNGYARKIDQALDARILVNAKKELVFEQEPYIQVFGDRHGFLSDLSALDLLFNKGPESKAYLKTIQLNLPNA